MSRCYRPGHERSHDVRGYAPAPRAVDAAPREPVPRASPEAERLVRVASAAVDRLEAAANRLRAANARGQHGDARHQAEQFRAAANEAEAALATLDREGAPAGCLVAFRAQGKRDKLAALTRDLAPTMAELDRATPEPPPGAALEEEPVPDTFAMVGAGDLVRVRRDWLTGSASPSAVRVRTDRVLEVMRGVRAAGAFAHATDADLEGAACAFTRVPSDEPGRVVTLDLSVAVGHQAGLMPGEAARVARHRDGLEAVFRLPVAAPSDEDRFVSLDADGVEALASALERSIDVGPVRRDAIARWGQRDPRVLVRHGAARVQLSGAACGDLFGAAWARWCSRQPDAANTARARQWLAMVVAVPTGAIEIDAELIGLIAEIDRHPKRADIVAHVRGYLETAPGIAITPALLETLAHDAVEAAARPPSPARAAEPDAPGQPAVAWQMDVALLAPRLGLGAVDVRSDAAARAVTDAAGAHGVALDGRVYLHPERVQPGTPEGRGVLAHELIHLAQARLGVEEDRDAAEDEAAELAPLVATGASVRPRLAIDLGSPAADNHAKRHRKHAPAPATTAAPTSSALGSLAASKHKLKLPRTVVGEHAQPRTVRIHNTGETTTELGDLRARDARTARIFPVYAAALEPIPPGGFVEIQIGFHPETTKIVSGDYQILDGDGALADTIHVVGQGETLERAAARAVHDGDDVRVATYVELEAALAASVRLAGSENADDRAEAYELADAVVHRLDAIADNVHRAAGDYGIASTTMVTSWGFGTTAVKTWWRALRGDLRPGNGDTMLVSFGAIREIVQIGTKELAHSKTLDALDSPGVTIAATALPLLAAVAAPAVVEAAPALLPWMLNNPNTALAVVDTSVALIPQVIDAGGPLEYVKAVADDPTKLVDFAMLMLQLRQARGADVALGGDDVPGSRPKAAAPQDGVVDEAPVTTTTSAKPVATGDVEAVHPQTRVAGAAVKAGAKVEALDDTQRESSGRRMAHGTSEGTAMRAPQPGEQAHEYQFNKMRPGPLTKDTMDVDDLNKGPASGFYGGQYDEIVLDQPAVLYRVASEREGKAGRGGLGRWFTESPLESDIQLQIDAAVKPVWPDKDGRIANARSPAEISMTVRVPAGTKVYRGPVASQGDGFVGGPDKIQLYIPGIRDQQGVEILVVAPFVRDGHVQPSPITDQEP